MKKFKKLPAKYKKFAVFFFSFLLVFASIATVALLPGAVKFSEDLLISSESEIPSNNAKVLGVQKYSYAPVSNNILAPILSAKGVFVEDLGTDTVLYQKNPDIRVPIASTTKIMTALVASKYFAPNTPLTSKLGASEEGSRVGLSLGETLSFRSLLYGMLLNSGNDAAFTIAENYPGGVEGFVSAMNKEALDLGLNNTHFDNPAGFDSPNHWSSASDLAKITKEALKDDSLSKIFATKDTTVSSLDKTKTHSLHNLNKLLSTVTGVLGVKTGFTNEAKENLVGLVERDNHRILTVVLGSDDRFGETSSLIEWSYQNFKWQD
jgi:serine-type D-Ala-D-Ala carboxypeptidase (penicillin-binding protein 5/6)